MMSLWIICLVAFLFGVGGFIAGWLTCIGIQMPQLSEIDAKEIRQEIVRVTVDRMDRANETGSLRSE